MVRPWFQFLVVQFLGDPLERVFLRSSGDCTPPVFRVPAKLLQMWFLRSSGFVYARAGLVALERVVLSGYKFWEMEIYARADWFLRSSGSALFLCLGARAGLIALERVQIFVLGARALCSPLERVMRI